MMFPKVRAHAESAGARGLDLAGRDVRAVRRRLVQLGDVVPMEARPTAPPLVGAGLDRIVHAQLGSQQAMDPLSLSARAEAELELLGSDGASWVVDLLAR
jgi:hypothetical protein